MVEGLPRATPRAAGATLTFSVARPSAALVARLMRGEVHVWRARAEEAGSYLKRDCLSLSEHERAARLRYGAHRELFVFARAMLRIVLGEYLSADPARLVFDVEPGGKPVLFGRDLEFSVSHASGWGAISNRLAASSISTRSRRPVSANASATCSRARRGARKRGCCCSAGRARRRC